MSQNCPESQTIIGDGAYDCLYSGRTLLWPSRAGRMVEHAVALRPPGKALDAGCGDGKNAAFLLANGWSVDAFDVSAIAIDACGRRLQENGQSLDRLWRADSQSVELDEKGYEMIVAYGLYHCLDDKALSRTHDQLVNALRPGGLFVCAAFNDRLPIPVDHKTGPLHLRSPDHLDGLFAGWTRIAHEIGEIEEDHLPVVGYHRHSLTWAIFEKIN
jgi:SAM-dependent methyltransferase